MTARDFTMLCIIALVAGAVLAAILPERLESPPTRIVPLGVTGWALVVR